MKGQMKKFVRCDCAAMGNALRCQTESSKNIFEISPLSSGEREEN